MKPCPPVAFIERLKPTDAIQTGQTPAGVPIRDLLLLSLVVSSADAAVFFVQNIVAVVLLVC
jgi:hypothetical protein